MPSPLLVVVVVPLQQSFHYDSLPVISLHRLRRRRRRFFRRLYQPFTVPQPVNRVQEQTRKQHGAQTAVEHGDDEVDEDQQHPFVRVTEAVDYFRFALSATLVDDVFLLNHWGAGLCGKILVFFGRGFRGGQ